MVRSMFRKLLEQSFLVCLLVFVLLSCAGRQGSDTPAHFDSLNRRVPQASYATNSTSFVFRGGQALDVGVGMKSGVYIVGSDHSVQQWTGSNTFKSLGGQALRVSVSPNGVPFVVGIDQALYQYDPNSKVFVNLGGRLIDVGVGPTSSQSTAVWVIGIDHQVYQYSSQSFTPMGIYANAIAVDGSGNPWIIDKNGAVEQWNGSVWHVIGGMSTDISIDQNTNTCWVVGVDGQAYYYVVGTEDIFIPTGKTFSAISAGGYGVWASAPSSATPKFALYQNLVKSDYYDPSPGTYPYFPGSIFTSSIPANVTPDANSAVWLHNMEPMSSSGKPFFHGLQFAFDDNNPTDILADYTEPVYTNNQPDAVTLNCTYYGNGCPDIPSSTILHVSLNALPQNGGYPNAAAPADSYYDNHMTIIDDLGGYEYDLFGVTWPPSNGILTVGIAGRCSLQSADFTKPQDPGCAATASHLPLTAGLIRVSDWLAALTDPQHGSLPYAIAFQAACSDGYTFPATSKDGTHAGCAPEGVRMYINLHDMDIDNIPTLLPLEKVIARTLDLDHFGAFLVDQTNTTGNDSFSFNVENDLTYTSFNLPGPLVNKLIPEYNNEANTMAQHYTNMLPPKSTEYFLPLNFSGLDLYSDARLYCVHAEPCNVSNP